MTQSFGAMAAAYDQCYETAEGKAILNAELACFRLMIEQVKGH